MSSPFMLAGHSRQGTAKEQPTGSVNHIDSEPRNSSCALVFRWRTPLKLTSMTWIKFDI